MSFFEIVAQRGLPFAEAPENTIPAYQRAIEPGADAVELDVRTPARAVEECARDAVSQVNLFLHKSKWKV